MRLIDADAFVKKFKYSEADTEDERIMCATARRMIREQPTAFDLDKVIEHLEDIQSALKNAEKTMEVAYVYNADGNLGALISKLKAGGMD